MTSNTYQHASFDNLPNDMHSHMYSMHTGDVIAVLLSVSRRTNTMTTRLISKDVEYYNKRNLAMRMVRCEHETDWLIAPSSLTVSIFDNNSSIPTLDTLQVGLALGTQWLHMLPRLKHLIHHMEMREEHLALIPSDLLTLCIHNDIDFTRFTQLRRAAVVTKDYLLDTRLKQLPVSVTELCVYGGPYMYELWVDHHADLLSRLTRLKLIHMRVYERLPPNIRWLSLIQCMGGYGYDSKYWTSRDYLEVRLLHDLRVRENLNSLLSWSYRHKEICINGIVERSDDDILCVLREASTQPNRCKSITIGVPHGNIRRVVWMGAMRVVFMHKPPPCFHMDNLSLEQSTL
jgi:hypothetical protein